MPTAIETLNHQYGEMRWRILSLAADFDRLDRTPGAAALQADPRVAELRQALSIVLTQPSNRAEQVQRLMSDTTPDPRR